MVYTFARIGAVVQLNVGDYFSQRRRGWLRFHEKGGKEFEAPCIPKALAENFRARILHRKAPIE